jgi:hypothetical protein
MHFGQCTGLLLSLRRASSVGCCLQFLSIPARPRSVTHGARALHIMSAAREADNCLNQVCPLSCHLWPARRAGGGSRTHNPDMFGLCVRFCPVVRRDLDRGSRTTGHGRSATETRRLKLRKAGRHLIAQRPDAGGLGGMPIYQCVVKTVTTPMAEGPAVGTEGTLWD